MEQASLRRFGASGTFLAGLALFALLAGAAIALTGRRVGVAMALALLALLQASAVHDLVWALAARTSRIANPKRLGLIAGVATAVVLYWWATTQLFTGVW